MSRQELFPHRPIRNPKIYAYEDTNPNHKGLLKIGYTARKTVDERVSEQFGVLQPEKRPYKVVFEKKAIREDGTTFRDKEIHKALIRKGIEHINGEWYRCTVSDVEAAYVAVYFRTQNEENRTESFSMRPEQRLAVEKTISYFINEGGSQSSPKFLWNAKMRFGKTFAAYQLAKQLKMKRILVLTFKPAVESAWEDDLKTHIDFEGWQFISRTSELTYDDANKKRPIVCFGSFQDYLGTNENGGIKAKNEWVHTTNWDIVIFDEYHFGAWRENAKKLFEDENEDNYDFDPEQYKREEADNAINESFLPITSKYYLYLSGTPFRAINSGEFIEDQIFSWSYSDEQSAKEKWIEPPNNPYAALPRMVMLTYKIPDEISRVAQEGVYDEFNLNEFFAATGIGKKAAFKHKSEVQKWLSLIRGQYLASTQDELRLGAKKPKMPFGDADFLQILNHSFWFLPNVASCYAMANLLAEKQNIFYHDYEVIVAAGASAGIGLQALSPVKKAMGNPLKTKTITLSCMKLTTGVTVKPWSGIFMLRNLSSPETYFQAAFRVQSPWEGFNDEGEHEIYKKECYIFDFALNRALRQISDYCIRLNTSEKNPEKKVQDFINFLPVIAFDGSTMKEINAAEILDITTSGTSATLLARRWESALLVNVDNETLKRLLNNKDAMEALMNIEGFRSLNKDIETIINKTNEIKDKKSGTSELNKKEKREISAAEKELKTKRKIIQEKLIKFATRIPIFMFLTDYREFCLQDVITKIEQPLFKRVTGLSVKDFELLTSLGVFNEGLMNDAVYKFRRYEESSLNYTGIDRHAGEKVGGFVGTLSAEEYKNLYATQQASIDDITAITKVSSSKLNEKPDRVPIDKGIDKVKIEPDVREDIDYNKVVVGARVVHKSFGEGVIKKVDINEGHNDKIVVDFAAGTKMFMTKMVFENSFLKLK